MTRSSSQHGAVLIVALILLVLITLIGVSTASLINSNTKVLANFEGRAAVKSAAISALQQAIARGTLVSSDVVFANPCTTSRTTCIDANGDGALVAGQDILVTISDIKCISAAIISNDELDVFSSLEDQSCYQPPQAANPGNNDSLCAEATWDVAATAVDPITGASSTVRQGLSTRTQANLISTACNSSGS